ncbi:MULTISPECIES: glycosyltransferase family 2 protein [unclassified Pseudoalteromonas]|uniref:glycosyltransferase family 2 protein n=1 Tax=unclassified Pseudoalteromonas TaxID=194690 RepID=UPI002358370C|nr:MULTISPECIES: glycosyltransferase family 2 protein [unclassified Pseudoalteromonas]MDC9499811.1 glycosyltransferase family 2 protein [Pseudoalteromonas sp. Angola-20]MDC9518590.1 glycosyltransferase family 2 protein [Pseudoalteromonas sp. Angola-22]MDC9534997.1 glycosyltransferase family 2 protein [Pseudoalteromonas sp. Angola-9]
MFSIIIPLYNKELSVKKTIYSVINQSFRDFEVIIVNDGSTDNSVKVIETIDDARIRVIHQVNQGVSAARNYGIQEAKNQWISFLDADDLWEVDHLLEIKSMISKYPKEKFFATSFSYSDNRKVFRYERDTAIFKVENYFKDAIKEHLAWTSIVVVNKNCFDKAGMFNQVLTRGEDLDLWGRLARFYPLIKSSKITAVYRIEAENRSDLSFNIKKSRVFNYDFETSTSKEETGYYVNQVVKALRGFIIKREFRNFSLLFIRHFNYIPLSKLLKK